MPSSGDLPDPGIKPMSLTSPVLAGSSLPCTSLGKPTPASWCHAITQEMTNRRNEDAFSPTLIQTHRAATRKCARKQMQQTKDQPTSFIKCVTLTRPHSKSQNLISSSVKCGHLLHLCVSFAELFWGLSAIMYMTLPTSKPGWTTGLSVTNTATDVCLEMNHG